LIDYELPEIDGMAAAKLIAHLMGEGVRPSLVALTASPDVLKRELGQAGWVFDRIVGKQEGFVALMTIVKECLDCSARRVVEHPGEVHPDSSGTRKSPLANQVCADSSRLHDLRRLS
jgi:CheY-like chemotaxis protein